MKTIRTIEQQCIDSLYPADILMFVKAHCKRKDVRILNWVTGQRRSRRGFWTVTSPMHVFKKVRRTNDVAKLSGNDGIANLIIPVGATIYIDEDWLMGTEGNPNEIHSRKIRASEAYVHSIATICTKLPVAKAASDYDRFFYYIPGTIAKPTRKFSRGFNSCSSGIHFFTSLQDALDW